MLSPRPTAATGLPRRHLTRDSSRAAFRKRYGLATHRPTTRRQELSDRNRKQQHHPLRETRLLPRETSSVGRRSAACSSRGRAGFRASWVSAWCRRRHVCGGVPSASDRSDSSVGVRFRVVPFLSSLRSSSLVKDHGRAGPCGPRPHAARPSPRHAPRDPAGRARLRSLVGAADWAPRAYPVCSMSGSREPAEMPQHGLLCGCLRVVERSAPKKRCPRPREAPRRGSKESSGYASGHQWALTPMLACSRQCPGMPWIRQKARNCRPNRKRARQDLNLRPLAPEATRQTGIYARNRCVGGRFWEQLHHIYGPAIPLDALRFGRGFAVLPKRCGRRRSYRDAHAPKPMGAAGLASIIWSERDDRSRAPI